MSGLSGPRETQWYRQAIVSVVLESVDFVCKRFDRAAATYKKSECDSLDLQRRPQNNTKKKTEEKKNQIRKHLIAKIIHGMRFEVFYCVCLERNENTFFCLWLLAVSVQRVQSDKTFSSKQKSAVRFMCALDWMVAAMAAAAAMISFQSINKKNVFLYISRECFYRLHTVSQFSCHASSPNINCSMKCCGEFLRWAWALMRAPIRSHSGMLWCHTHSKKRNDMWKKNNNNNPTSICVIVSTGLSLPTRDTKHHRNGYLSKTQKTAY